MHPLRRLARASARHGLVVVLLSAALGCAGDPGADERPLLEEEGAGIAPEDEAVEGPGEDPEGA